MVYHRPVCVRCQCELKPEKNGVGLLDMFDAPESKPYQLWDADLWKCPKCGIEIITGFGAGPLAIHFQENGETLKKTIQSYESYSQVVKNYPI